MSVFSPSAPLLTCKPPHYFNNLSTRVFRIGLEQNSHSHRTCLKGVAIFTTGFMILPSNQQVRLLCAWNINQMRFWLERWQNASCPSQQVNNSSSSSLKTATILREFWSFPKPVTKLHSYNPCQSTGLWYIRPTPAAKAFMSAMAQRLFDVTHQWDQTAWNEVILPFLWGYGDEAEQLKYRLLPHASYANVNVVDMRCKEGLPVDLVVLHSGHLHGKEKVRFCVVWIGVYPDLCKHCGFLPVALHGPKH